MCAVRSSIPLPPPKQQQHRVKSYESKLAALNALNGALQKENEQLQAQLEDVPVDEEAAELKEEFARRLGEQQRTIDILKVCCVGWVWVGPRGGGRGFIIEAMPWPTSMQEV